METQKRRRVTKQMVERDYIQKNMAIEIVVERRNQARVFFVFMRDH